MKHLFLVFVLLFSFNLSVKACTNEEKQLIYNQLNKVVVGYVPNKESCLDDEDICTMLFKIEIQGMGNLLYAKNESGQEIIKEGIQSNGYYYSGIPYAFNIYAENKECFTEKVATKNLIIPYYNFWSLEKECETAKDFKYCKTYLNNPLDIDTNAFKSVYQNYLNEKNNASYIDENVSKWQDNIKEFFLSYYIYILIFIILSGLTGIFFLIRKERKERLI